MTVMRKWFKKNENALIKLGAILFVLNFISLFPIEDNILPIMISFGCFTLYTNREDYLRNDHGIKHTHHTHVYR